MHSLYRMRNAEIHGVYSMTKPPSSTQFPTPEQNPTIDVIYLHTDIPIFSAVPTVPPCPVEPLASPYPKNEVAATYLYVSGMAPPYIF